MCDEGVITFCAGLLFGIPVATSFCIGGGGYFLLVDIESSTLLLLRTMNDYIVRRHQESPYTAVGGPHHSEGEPTMEVAACTRVGLTPFGDEEAGQVFHNGLCFGTHKAVQ